MIKVDLSTGPARLAGGGPGNPDDAGFSRLSIFSSPLFFGLVHGFGFASALRDLGIGSGAGAALPLVSFNVGVEIGQLGIAALVLPLLWSLRKRPAFVTRFAPICSILVSIAGGFWLVERVLGK